MVVGHDDDIVIPGEVLAIVAEQVVTAAADVSASVHEDHHRPFSGGGGEGRCPDVQPKAIFAAGPASGTVQQEGIFVGAAAVAVVVDDSERKPGAGVPVAPRQFRTPAHGTGFCGGMNRFAPVVEAP